MQEYAGTKYANKKYAKYVQKSDLCIAGFAYLCIFCMIFKYINLCCVAYFTLLKLIMHISLLCTPSLSLLCTLSVGLEPHAVIQAKPCFGQKKIVCKVKEFKKMNYWVY